MKEIKVEIIFKKGTDRRCYTKTYYGTSLNDIMSSINSFAESMREKGWNLWENRLLSVRDV
jgi:hypothetical protein